MSKRVTGGIVTYNNEDTIERCIDSVLKFTVDCDFELYVYDNGSVDHTVDIIRRCFPQVKVVVGTKNLGFGGGHNRIMKHLISDFHVIINPDIELRENVIGAMAEYMDKNADVVQVTTEVRNLDNTIQYLPKVDPNFKYVVLSKLKPFRKYRSMYTQEFVDFDGPTEILSSTGCFSMVRTTAFKSINGYDQRFFLYFEDADLSRRLREIGKIIFLPDLYVYHAWKRDNTRSIKGIMIFLNSMFKYYKKWR